MTRQEAVIKISKITRIIGELKYQLDADDEIEFEALDPDWLHIAEWTQEICRYMTQDASPQVARLIANIGFTEIVEKYVQSHRQEIEAPHAKILDDYVEGIRNLSLLCDTRSDKQKKKYADLIEPLANEQVAALLKRAVGAGLLDEHYQPTPQTKSLQLKVIAYAVSFLCQLPSVYVLFEKQWKTENGSATAVFPDTMPAVTKKPKLFIRRWIFPNSNPYTKSRHSMCRKARRSSGLCMRIW